MENEFSQQLQEMWDSVPRCVPMEVRAKALAGDPAGDGYWGGVTVSTQPDLEAALDAADVLLIVVESAGLTVTRAPVGDEPVVAVSDVEAVAGRVYVRESLHVTVSGDAEVYAEGTARVTASGDAEVYACGKARVEADGSAQIEACDEAKVTAAGMARITACEGVSVSVAGGAKADVSGVVSVSAAGEAKVTALEDAYVDAQESAEVTASGRARVLARGEKQVRVYGEAWVAATGGATVFGDGEAVRIWAADHIVVDAPHTVLLRVPEDLILGSHWGTLERLWDEAHPPAMSEAAWNQDESEVWADAVETGQRLDLLDETASA
ncbi:hypothetical protein AB0N09_39465 [Streptomyces erythrochromogenes]|uniref:hypothetical protein n=1 Tax=Streptomyces erythrochromogenes TaxID=285574 RepID=UPI0034335968